MGLKVAEALWSLWLMTAEQRGRLFQLYSLKLFSYCVHSIYYKPIQDISGLPICQESSRATATSWYMTSCIARTSSISTNGLLIYTCIILTFQWLKRLKGVKLIENLKKPIHIAIVEWINLVSNFISPTNDNYILYYSSMIMNCLKTHGFSSFLGQNDDLQLRWFTKTMICNTSA